MAPNGKCISLGSLPVIHCSDAFGEIIKHLKKDVVSFPLQIEYHTISSNNLFLEGINQLWPRCLPSVCFIYTSLSFRNTQFDKENPSFVRNVWSQVSILTDFHIWIHSSITSGSLRSNKVHSNQVARQADLSVAADITPHIACIGNYISCMIMTSVRDVTKGSSQNF